MRIIYPALTLFLALLAFGCKNSSPESSSEAAAESPSGQWADPSIELPDGFQAIVVADDIGRGRHIAVRENGDIYVQLSAEKNGKGIAALRDENGDGHADRIEYFGNHTGTGMAIYNGFLYCSSDREVYRYPLPEDGQLVPDESQRVLIAGGFPEQTSHEAKSITFDGEGHLYVNVGAPSNACTEPDRERGAKGQDPCPQLEWHGGIWRFDASRTAQTQKQDGLRYATGLRNCVALEWNPIAGSLYAMQHGRDQLGYLYPDLYTDKDNAELPAEEFLQIDEGDDFGWPYCYFDQRKGQKIQAPEYGGDGQKQGRCADIKKPIVAFPGHMAPNDLVFYTATSFPEKYHNGAFIAFHGSWNRAPLPQKGYFVAFVPMKDGQASGDWEIFADNIAGLETVAQPSDALHRPTGLAIGPDGSLYIADSVKGKIWKIAYSG
ncbi:MAG: PQQ-dependent sugar dehydrogenase [Phaeodactylibacter sp.]|nr:PQQ-dependent sugar dehydrogenase [Phaeodactylibacter sp.]MCB9301408.1 PQQ-dependent sugar dehydrogenase [Lewinellaceae bacterium]